MSVPLNSRDRRALTRRLDHLRGRCENTADTAIGYLIAERDALEHVLSIVEAQAVELEALFDLLEDMGEPDDSGCVTQIARDEIAALRQRYNLLLDQREIARAAVVGG